MMKNRLLTCIILLLALFNYSTIYAVPGPLFSVTGQGVPGTVEANVWLNGDAPISGQKVTVNGGHTLIITPTRTNHTYPAMGLEILTPGVTVTTGCSRTVGNRCIFSASNNQPATITTTPPTGNHYLFITSTSYTGNLGGVTGADAICTAVAQGSGNTIINTLPFKAVLVASTRYPCDINGDCGGAHSLDWPLLPNTQYLNPDNTAGTNFTTNTSSVFTQPGGSTTAFQDQTGQPDNAQFWSGIQSILNDSVDEADIIGWGYYNVNIESSVEWARKLASCNDWTSDTLDNLGSTGIEQEAIPFGAVVAGIWGNYFYQTDAQDGFIVSTWVASDTNICNAGAALICAS